MSENEWPRGHRHAMSQCEHEKWNATHYPGTRQICIKCDEPTGCCEDDGFFDEDGDPYCWKCWSSEAAPLYAETSQAIEEEDVPVDEGNPTHYGLGEKR